MHALAGKTILLHDLGRTLRTTSINGNHTFEIRMPQVVSLDGGKLGIDRSTGGDLDEADRRNRRQDRFDPVDAGLDVQRTWSCDEPGDSSRGDERGNAPAHLHSRLEEVLPNVGQASVVTAGWCIGII